MTKKKRRRLDWKPETRSLLRALSREGFAPVEVHDGEGGWEPAGDDEDRIIAVLTSVDVSHLRVRKGTFGARLTLVYGNCPGELVSDYAWARGDAGRPELADLDRILDAHFDAWIDRKQPTTYA